MTGMYRNAIEGFMKQSKDLYSSTKQNKKYNTTYFRIFMEKKQQK